MGFTAGADVFIWSAQSRDTSIFEKIAMTTDLLGASLAAKVTPLTGEKVIGAGNVPGNVTGHRNKDRFFGNDEHVSQIAQLPISTYNRAAALDVISTIPAERWGVARNTEGVVMAKIRVTEGVGPHVLDPFLSKGTVL